MGRLAIQIILLLATCCCLTEASSSPSSPAKNLHLEQYLLHYNKGIELLNKITTQQDENENQKSLALAQSHFLQSHSILPRAEPFYQLAQHYYSKGDWGNSFFWAKMAFQIPFPGDQLGEEAKQIYRLSLPTLVAELAWLFGDFQLGEFAAQKAISLLSPSDTALSTLKFYHLLYQQKKLITKSFFKLESKKALSNEAKFVNFIHEMERTLSKDDLNFTQVVSQFPILQELKVTHERRHLVYLLHFLDLFLQRESLRELRRKSDPIGHTVWGHITQIPIQLDYYYRLASSPLIRTVCETGFNAGHSTLLWLHANPSVRVISFDIKERFYVDPAMQFVEFLYPGKVTLVLGDSRTAVREFFSKKENENITCDLVHVDGDHESDGAYLDIKNFMPQANTDSIVLLDDTTSFFGPKFAKSQTAKEGSVQWKQCFEKSGDPNLGNEFCVGKYTGELSPETGRLHLIKNFDLQEEQKKLAVPKAEIASRNSDITAKPKAYCTLISSHTQIPSIVKWVTSIKQTQTKHEVVVLSTVTGFVFEQIKWTCRGLGCLVVRVAKLTNPNQGLDFSKLHTFGLELYSQVAFMNVGEENQPIINQNIDWIFPKSDESTITIFSSAEKQHPKEAIVFGENRVTVVTPARNFFENLKEFIASSSSFDQILQKFLQIEQVDSKGHVSYSPLSEAAQNEKNEKIFQDGLKALEKKLKEDGAGVSDGDDGGDGDDGTEGAEGNINEKLFATAANIL